MNLEHVYRLPELNTGKPPLLFVHGAWHAAWCWEEHFLDYFAQHGYSAHALSLRGHGSSGCSGSLRSVSIDQYVEDLAFIAAQLPEPPIIIGHSMGGLVVQKYLETHHARAAVLLAAVPPMGIWSSVLKVLIRHPLRFMLMNLTWSLRYLVNTPALVRELFYSSEIPESQLASYASRIQDESYRAFLDMLVFNLPRPERVAVPVLVMGASDDFIFSPAVVSATASAYGTRAEIVPHMAHDMMLEKNWQTVADHMLKWMAQVEGAANG